MPFVSSRQVLFLLVLLRLLVVTAMNRGLDASVKSDLAPVRRHLQSSQDAQRPESH